MHRRMEHQPAALRAALAQRTEQLARHRGQRLRLRIGPQQLGRRLVDVHPARPARQRRRARARSRARPQRVPFSAAGRAPGAAPPWPKPPKSRWCAPPPRRQPRDQPHRQPRGTASTAARRRLLGRGRLVNGSPRRLPRRFGGWCSRCPSRRVGDRIVLRRRAFCVGAAGVFRGRRSLPTPLASVRYATTFVRGQNPTRVASVASREA